MTNSIQPAPPQKSPDVFEGLAIHLQVIAYIVIALGLGVAAVPITFGVLYHWNDFYAVLVWGFVVSVTICLLGVLLLMRRDDFQLSPANSLRMLAVVLGGLVGFFTALFGLALPIFQYRNELSGGLQAWREQRQPLSWSAAAFLGGLVLMFVSLLQARAYERTQPALRRLVYGFNAVLGGLLLLCILILVNILPYSPVWPLSTLGRPLDMTRTGDFTLQPATVSMLAQLNKPLRIYVLLADRDVLDGQTAILMEQCRAANGLISWETVSRDLTPDKWKELEKAYKVPGSGMLLVYGSPPNEETEHIKFSDLYKPRLRSDGGQEPIYQGEYALFGAITSLYEGKSKPVVYFTQGNGELEMQGQGFGEDSKQSMTLFIEELSKSNYDIKPLPFDRKALEKSKSVPDDADVVVIAGPRQPLSQDAIDALRKYLKTPRGAKKQKGKLIVLLDVVVDEQKRAMVETNLEPLLREYNVEVPNSSIMAIRDSSGITNKIVVMTNPRSKSPIGAAFNTGQRFQGFLFDSPRPVGPAQPKAPGRESLNEVDVLMATYTTEAQLTWAENDVVATPTDLWNKIKKGNYEPDFAQLSVGVTVSEPKESADLPMGHPSTEQTPRMVVFGDARWLANSSEGKLRSNNTALFASCISWLRERGDIGPPPQPKDHPTYSLSVPDFWTGVRLGFLPGVLLVLGIATLGSGVWIVRRR